MIIVISTAITYSSFSINQISQVAQTVEIKQTIDFEKTTEEFDVITFTNVNNQFNMTVTNRGDMPVHLTRLWVENTTDNTWPVSKYDLDIAIPTGGSVTNIGQGIGLTVVDTQSYQVKLVTERGNIQKMFANSDGGDSIYLSLSATPTIIPTTFSTTVSLDVINTGSNKLINLQPEMDSVVTSCVAACSATLVSGPTPTNFDTLDPGDIAVFEWVYTILGEDTGDSVTFTASLVNGVDEDTAIVTVQPIINAINAGISLTSGGLEEDASVTNDILLFHMEQAGVPSPGYQMMSSDVEGGTEGLLFNMETQTVGSAVGFMTNNGSNTITVPAGNWVASLALRSEAVATGITQLTNMTFHFEDGDGVDPDNSEGTSTRDLDECGALPFTFQERITQSGDDAEENKAGDVDVAGSSGDLELVFEADEQWIGVRWSLDVPKDSTITSADIRWRSDEAQAGTSPVIQIRAHDVDNAPIFTTAEDSISDRLDTATSAQVIWSSIPAWSIDEEGSDTTTPDLSTIVQEIVNRSGWVSGNNIAFIFYDDQKEAWKRTAEHWDGTTGTYGARLTVSYTTPSATPPDWQAGTGPHSSGSYYYDGVNECHRSSNDISTGDGNLPGSTDYTTSLWFRTDGSGQVSSEQMLVSWQASGDADYHKISLGEDTTGKILFEYHLGGSDKSTCRSVNEYDDGAWHHVVAVRTGALDRCDLYITDTAGADEETSITSSPNTGSSSVDADGKWYVASNDETSNYFKGWIDDVMHWNKHALSSSEADDLSHTNYGTGAHQLNINIDKTDENGVFTSSLYAAPTTLIAFQDAKSQSSTTDAAYTMYNVTIAMPQTVVLPLQRLNFSMAFIPSTATWEALELDFKVDDTGFTSPHPSYMQIPMPDYPFTSYITYDNDDELELIVNNVGDDGVYFIYSGTRLSFDGDNGSYASLIHYINGTSGNYVVDIDNDSIYIPVGESARMIFYDQPTDHPCQGTGSSCLNANVIPAGDYRIAAWINGYSDQAESFGRSVVLGNILVEE